MNDDDKLLEELGEALGYDPNRAPPSDRVTQVRAAAERMRAAQSQDEASDADDSESNVAPEAG